MQDRVHETNRRVSLSETESLHSSFHSSYIGGLSFEEITCDERDDILPKTDYTYARSASYSPRYIRKKKVRQPNMSRRRMRGEDPTFLSDDEDDEYYDDDAVLSSSRQGYSYRSQTTQEMDQVSESTGRIVEYVSERHNGSRARSQLVTSTPMIHDNDHHISSHDHYYEGMLLRSGSHIKGLEREKRLREAAARNSNNSNNSVLSWLGFGGDNKSKNKRLNEDYLNEEEEEDVVDDEYKLRLDESQTEKDRRRDGVELQHLYGLDSDEEISDIDDDYNEASNRRKTYSPHLNPFVYFFTTIFTTITTTVTTLSSDFWSHVIVPAVVLSTKPVTVPARWLWYGIYQTCSWLITQTSHFILWDIQLKQRNKRGCCCCFLPLLLLLPFLLLGSYYAKDVKVKDNMVVYFSNAESYVSNYWSSLWVQSPHYVQPAVPVVPPTPEQVSSTPVEIDYSRINQYIHQTVQTVVAANRDDRPVGLTANEVEIIVRRIVTAEMNSIDGKVDEKIELSTSTLNLAIAAIKDQLSTIDRQALASGEAAKIAEGSLDGLKLSIESSAEEQRTQYLAALTALETKLASLRMDVNSLSEENSSLKAKIGKCCNNHSLTEAIVKEQVITLLNEAMETGEESELSNFVYWMNSKYVNRAEYDQGLSRVTSEIMDKVAVLIAQSQREAETTVNIPHSTTHTNIVSGIDEVTVKSIVEEALIKYSADRIALPDFALETAGGSIIGVRCSETYYRKTALVSVFGVPLWYTSNSPRTVIQPGVYPGECWAFKGGNGFIVIQLSVPIQPTMFTLEHLPKSLSPNGKIDSAPKEFSVIGLDSEVDTVGTSLGNFTYHEDGKSIQHFYVKNGNPGIYRLVELRILSNHGNPEYTCVYRFRVHGLP